MSKKKNTPLISVIQIILLILFILCLRTFILSPITVLGISMEPTYEEADKVWKSPLIKPKRFDSVTFYSPRNGKHIIKRVIGLPGDSVEMIDDQLFINDEAVDEPYLDELKQKLTEGESLTNNFSLSTISNGTNTVVPDNHYFVLGDNRQLADDSRYFGFVDESLLTGTVYFRYYPFNKIGTM